MEFQRVPQLQDHEGVGHHGQMVGNCCSVWVALSHSLHVAGEALPQQRCSQIGVPGYESKVKIVGPLYGPLRKTRAKLQIGGPYLKAKTEASGPASLQASGFFMLEV